MEGFNVFRNSKSVYKINKKTLNGVSYLVVPVVMMVEGVHTGSQGAVYHSIDELGKFPASWNGIPVVINHPQDTNGNYISANSPNVKNVGVVYNTYVDEDKLKGEVWIDESKISEQSPITLGYLRQGKPLDVSVGVFTDNEQTEGEWNGETYISIAKNHRPDHLALLPGEQGACSWDDGCGIRVNSSDTKKQKDVKIMLNKDDPNFMDLLVANVIGKSATTPLQTNALNYSEIIRAVQIALNAMDERSSNESNVYSYHYAVEIYSDFVVYEVSSQTGTVYYKSTYQINDDGSATIGSERTKVRKEVKYVQTNKKEETHMANKSSCCLAKIEQLITNATTKFTEDDKEWLLSLDESTIDKLFPNQINANSAPVDEAQVIQTFKNTLQKEDDFLGLMPDDIKTKFAAGIALHTEKRKNLIDSIIANTASGTWEENELNQMSDSTLEKIAKSAIKPDYSGVVSANASGTQPKGVEILLPIV